MQITIKELEEKGIIEIINLRVFRDLMYGNVSCPWRNEKEIRMEAENVILLANKVSVAHIRLEGLDNYYSKDPTKIVGLNEEFEERIKIQSKKFINALFRLNSISGNQLILRLIDKDNEILIADMALRFAELKLERFIKKEA